jgi:acetyl-CoA C-acetyltransferase
MTMEQLQKLPPGFIPKTGKVTAGNSSGLNDGSAGMILMSAEKAKELGLTPIARIKATSRGGCHPAIMGLSPVPAIKNLLEKNKLKLSDFELIEVNEAFASAPIALMREFGIDDDGRVNPNGGACALGHPVGASGARLVGTTALELRRRGGRYGLATICGGMGHGAATILEAI